MIRNILLGVLLAVSLGANAQRDTLSLNRGWQFKYGNSSSTAQNTDFSTSDVQQVNLPHDFQISQPWVAPAKNEKADNSDQAANVKSRLSARAFKEMGVGVYRKVLHAPKEWQGRRLLLDFGGIMLVGDVYLNGNRIGGTDYGYVGFDIDVTKQLRYGADNELVVVANTMAPNNSRWYTGGGLYRDVRLIATNRDLYFEHHPLFLSTPGNKQLNVTAEVSNYTKSPSGLIEVAILDANGHQVAVHKQSLTFSRKRRTREYVLDSIPLSNPQLWSCDHPYLYTAVVSLYRNDGTVADRVSEQFGVRTFEFSPQFGLKLNGEKVILKGIANHHTLGSLGAAAYPRAIEKRIKLLKSFGFNHIRCSHNPYSEDLYRLCDKYGIIVIDELYDKWLQQYAGGRTPWTNLWQHDIPEWVKRDRNHPSVALWSLGNELQTYTNLPFNDWGVTAYRLQRELVKRYDPTRLTTVAMHPRGRSEETDSLPCDLAKITDIQAYNYRYAYFPGDGRRFPYMIFYQSEANLPMMGPNYFGMDLNKVVGLAYWGMIDYLGESMGWPAKGWFNGVFDISLQPKPMAYFVKSMFSNEPVVHIGIVDNKSDAVVWNGVKFGGETVTDHWNRTPGSKYTLYTYTNADEVELLVNGKSMGVKKNTTDPNTRNKIKWTDIAYEPGYVEAVARKDGKTVARHRINTYGKVSRLQLVPDQEVWKADGTDLQHVTVYAVDKNGNKVWDDTDELTFSVEGDASIVAVSNGDITTDENLAGNRIRLFHGSAMVILRAGVKPSAITLTVSAAGKKDYKLKLNTRQ
ncbi:MAG: glycoside hydrolase family 2 TIM barrel-domain containing protein [Prevotella sp.]|nr:glycoside hydrolase family 2 TIM barrel-domain containing protein [Prevotella sp.]